MAIAKPTRADVMFAGKAVVGVLLVKVLEKPVGSKIREMISQYNVPLMNTITNVIIGLVLYVVLAAVKQRDLASITFGVAVALGVAEDVLPMIEANIPAQG